MNVTAMGFMGSPAYTQQQIDRILWEFREFARVYIDNVAVFSKMLQDHLTHLRKVFSLFKEKCITLKGSKSFLGYLSTTLLGQKINGFGLSMAIEKLAAITALEFPHILKDFKLYLELTRWLQNYIPYYAQISQPLQQRKTMMLKASPQKEKPRKGYTKKAIIDGPTKKEKVAFKTL